MQSRRLFLRVGVTPTPTGLKSGPDPGCGEEESPIGAARRGEATGSSSVPLPRLREGNRVTPGQPVRRGGVAPSTPLRPGNPSGTSHLGHSLCCGHRSDPVPQSHGPYPSEDHHDTDRRSDPDTLEAGKGVFRREGRNPARGFTPNAQATATGEDFPTLVSVKKVTNPLRKQENPAKVLQTGDGADPLALRRIQAGNRAAAAAPAAPDRGGSGLKAQPDVSTTRFFRGKRRKGGRIIRGQI